MRGERKLWTCKEVGRGSDWKLATTYDSSDVGEGKEMRKCVLVACANAAYERRRLNRKLTDCM